MNKLAAVAVGLVAVGALSTAGAWYTGTQLPGVLDNLIDEANKQGADALLGTGVSTKLELLSLETRLFSSTAHYRFSLDAPAKDGEPRHVEILLVDNIQHGPLPASRLMRLNLWPVMAASNYQLEANELTQKWFDAAKGAAPLTGTGVLGYDGSTQGTLVLTPLDFAPSPTSAVKFSGMTLDIEASKNAKQVQVSGGMDSLLLSSSDETPMQVDLRDLTLSSEQRLGSGDFYVGDSSIKLATAQIKVGDKPAVLLNDLAQVGSLQESGTALHGQIGYDIGKISYDGKEIGGLRTLWAIKNFDSAALQSLIKLYQDKLVPVQQAQALGEEAPQLDLSAEDEARLKADLEKLLAGKPQLALDNFTLTTAHGQASLRVVLDLDKPESFELAPDELARQMIAKLEAKLSVAKAVIGDGVRIQAMVEGVTDAKAIEEQATMMTEMGSGMALGTGLVTLEGETLQSTLHYADNKVTFNGQDMSVEEFVTLVMSKTGGMGGGLGDDASAYGDDAPEDLGGYDDGAETQAPDQAE
ncbi:YdgA family protein [Pseudomonas sp. D1-3]